VGVRTLEDYIGRWLLWCQFRFDNGRTHFIRPSNSLAEAEQLMHFAVESCDGRGNCVDTIKGKVDAIAHFHWQYARRELPTTHRLLTDLYAGMGRVGAAAGKAAAQPLREPLTIKMLMEARPLAMWRGMRGGRVVWCGIALSYFFLARASELWRAEGAVGSEMRLLYEQYTLVRSDITFWCGKEQVPWAERSRATKVNAHFRVSKTDQFRRGKNVERMGQGLAVVLALLEEQERWGLPQSAALMTRRSRSGAFEVIPRWVAAEALTTMVKAVGGNPDLIKLHSGRVGGATAGGAAGLSAVAMEKLGRWAHGSKVPSRYVRDSDQLTAQISAALDAFD
jgi:hypothetical protein